MTYRYNGQVLSNNYRPGTGRIWLDNVTCLGCETSISQCRHRGWGVHNSTHAEDVSISCYFDSTTKYAGQCFRLVWSRPCTDRHQKWHESVICERINT